MAGYLDELGVSVHQGARVSSIDEHGVSFELDGAQQRIDTPTVVWGAGVQAAGFTGLVSSCHRRRDAIAAGGFRWARISASPATPRSR